MELMTAIKERRSIRKYRKDPVPEAILFECLEAARLAPSWHNYQIWRFVVVRDQRLKVRLSGVLVSPNPAHQAIIDAPYVICAVAEKGVSGFIRGTAVTNKGDWFMLDVGIAMEHFVLAAWSFGLGTVHVGAFDADAAEKILGIPGEYSIVEMTPLGYFEETPRQVPRRPLEQLVYLDHFGNPCEESLKEKRHE